MSTQPAGWYARLSASPAVMALIGGTAAVGAGVAVMLAQGGEQAIFYGLVNAGALPVGLLFAALLLLTPDSANRALALAAALALLATAVLGTEIEGIRRWVSVAGAIQIQPSFILLPLLLCTYARRHGEPWHGAAAIIAALAIGLMPDLSMAMALFMVCFAVWLADRTRIAALVLAAATLALLACLSRADPLTGVRFVEHVLVEGWRSGAVSGLILTAGALAMLAPFLTARRAAPEYQRAIIAFTFCWGMLLIASLIGAYPTPLLGYGPSAIIGYFLSIIPLRRATRHKESL